MGEINATSQLSFNEIAKRTDKNGMPVQIFEAMEEVNPVFKFIPAIECNHPYQHWVPRRTSKGTATWRKFYKGSATTATTTQVAKFEVGLLEARSEVDEDIVDGAAGGEAGRISVRRTEDIGIASGMGDQVMDTLISGTSAGSPEEIDGLQQYLNSLSQLTVMDGNNDGGTSIYIVDFNTKSGAYMIYPAGGNNGGLDVRTTPTGNAEGKKWVIDDDGNEYLAYCTQFKWWVGLCITDELAVGRYANINPTVGGSNTFNENELIKILEYGHFRPATTFILVSKEIKAQMTIRAKDKNNVNFDFSHALSGEEIVTFGGQARVLRCDSISTSETVVV